MSAYHLQLHQNIAHYILQYGLQLLPWKEKSRLKELSCNSLHFLSLQIHCDRFKNLSKSVLLARGSSQAVGVVNCKTKAKCNKQTYLYLKIYLDS